MRRSTPVLVVFLVALAGCSSSRPAYRPDEERPRTAFEARWWEEQGDKELERALAADRPRVKERYFAYAVQDYRHARDLYYDELESLENAPATDLDTFARYPEIRYASGGPIPAGRREALEIEITRLSAEIEQLVRERPIQDPPPVTVEQKLFPR